MGELSTGAKVTIVILLISIVIGLVSFFVFFYGGTTEEQSFKLEKSASAPRTNFISQFDNKDVYGAQVRRLIAAEPQGEDFTVVIKNGEYTYCYGKGIQMSEDFRPKFLLAEQRGNSCSFSTATAPLFPNPTYQPTLAQINDFISPSFVGDNDKYKSFYIYDYGSQLIGVVLEQY